MANSFLSPRSNRPENKSFLLPSECGWGGGQREAEVGALSARGPKEAPR